MKIPLVGSIIGVKNQCYAKDSNICEQKLAFQNGPYEQAIGLAENSIRGRLMTRKASGAVLTVYVDGERIHSKAYGYADFENKALCTKDTKMRIGTVTMAFTSAQILNYLYQQNKCLDTKIEPNDCQYCTCNLSIKDLLNHCAGIRPASTDLFRSTKEYQSSIDRVEEIFKAQPMTPGQFLFSSDSYNLLGAYLQTKKLTYYRQMFYPRLFKALMADLDLRNTLMDQPQKIVPLLAKHYSSEASVARFSDPSNRYPSSGLISTAGDLAKFGNDVLYHEQFQRCKDVKKPYIRNTELKLWEDNECLRHNPEAVRKTTDCGLERKCLNTCGNRNSERCLGYSLGWHLQLVPTIAGSKHNYTITAYNEGLGGSFNSALVIRMGTDKNPFIRCAQSAKMENLTKNPDLAVNQERQRNTSQGIVVALIMNGAQVDAGQIAAKLAENLDKLRHEVAI